MSVAHTRRKRRLMIIAFVGATLAGAFLLVFHPDRPLRMKNTDVTIVAADGVQLAGTLSVPRGKEPIGAVVLVHGSGPLTRNEVRGDVRGLVDLGFAVLHYDKRGAGASGGTYMQGSRTPAVQLIGTLAADAATVFDTLRARMASDTPCGFFGASQAGWIIPLTATRCARAPEFHIILSGPAVSTGVEGYYSELTSDGTGDPRIADRDSLERMTLSYSGDPGYDPRPLWEDLHIPTLWLLGDRDGSVPTFATVRTLDELIAAGHAEHTIVRFPNAAHDLRDVSSSKAVPVWENVAEWYRNVAAPR